MKPILNSAAILAGLVLTATTAHAVTTYTYAVSSGTQPSNVGTVTVTQVNSTTVSVFVDLLAGYGFINSGAHTFFGFTLAGSESGVSADFTSPSGGSYTNSPNPTKCSTPCTLTLNLAGGSQPSFGTYGVAVDSSAGNGSSSGYFGDLGFDLTRTSGLSIDDFMANANGWYFTADLSDGSNTGAQGWNERRPPDEKVPEPATLALLGLGLIGLGAARRRRTAA